MRADLRFSRGIRPPQDVQSSGARLPPSLLRVARNAVNGLGCCLAVTGAVSRRRGLPNTVGDQATQDRGLPRDGNLWAVGGRGPAGVVPARLLRAVPGPRRGALAA